MSIQIREVHTESMLRDFVEFPYKLYNQADCWVPSLKRHELKSLMPKYNPAFNFCDVKLWVAENNNRIVGRVGAIINHLYNKKKGENMVRITRPEFVDDPGISAALFETVEDWALKKKMDGVHGPLGFTNFDHQGLLIEGFDYIPSIASEYHFPYYEKHFDLSGYNKEIDWVEFRLTIGNIPDKAKRLNQLIRDRYNLEVIRPKHRRDITLQAPRIFKLLNESFASLFGVIHFNEQMIQYYTERYLNFLDPRFVILVEDKSGELVGFILGTPSLSEAMRKANGYLFPFGWRYVRNGMKRPSVIDLTLTAVHPLLQAQGVPAILITELQETLLQQGVKYAETTGILETNEKAIQVWKNYEHVQHKRKRCFRKMFNGVA